MAQIPEEEDACLVLTEISSDELELLISFLYTGFITFASFIESQRFRTLIHHFGIEIPHSDDNVVEDDLHGLIVDDFGQSTVDQSEILYEFQSAQNVDEVNRILAEIISDYDNQQNTASKIP